MELTKSLRCPAVSLANRSEGISTPLPREPYLAVLLRTLKQGIELPVHKVFRTDTSIIQTFKAAASCIVSH